ncbi:amidohydrolase [Nocardioides antri]|uniref:amidohydrolase n=1 Tax=Nocardioides antri TaxID=2607659 RepID=UPI00165FB2C7|nr:amidohydrolase [Nocardioides antri]
MRRLYVAQIVHTLDPAAPEATGVLVEDGRVVAVGDAADLRGTGVEVVDHGDAVLTPGLVDGHAHPVAGLELTDGVDLTDALDLDAVRALLAEERDRLAPGAWLKGWGLNPVVFGGRAPTAEDLGPAFAGIPGYVQIYDGHASIASREALALAGVDGPITFASSSRVDLDADGRPTGYLVEADACEVVEKVIPPLTIAEQVDRLRALLGGMAAVGYTGLHAMDFRDPAHELVTLLEEDGELPLRMGFNPMLMPEDDGPDGVLALQGQHGRRWRVEGVKLMVDGTIDHGTGWLEYADTHGEGLDALWRDFDRFRDAVMMLHRAGVNCAVHAIGDRGVRQVIELFVALREQHGPLARHRIEHIETIPDDVVKMFGSGAAAASMQPLHCTCFNRADRSDSWSQRLGDIRVDNGFRWSDIRSVGGVVALGSDWPIAPYDPRWIMADARLRRRFDRPEMEAIRPEQALDARQVLEGFTCHAALASGEEDHRGRIAPGYDADFTVFGADPLTTAPEELGTIEIRGTVVAGEAVVT